MAQRIKRERLSHVGGVMVAFLFELAECWRRGSGNKGCGGKIHEKIRQQRMFF